MDALEEYFQTDFLAEKAEIDSITGLVAEVAPIFHKFLRLKGWPYELSNGGKCEVGKLSASTTAMMLFALARLLGRIRKGVLIPTAATQFHRIIDLDIEKERQKYTEAFEKGFLLLIKEHSAEGALYESSTFGKNDPFTLTWLVELLPLLEYVALSKENIKEFRQRVIDVSLELIRSTFKIPTDPVLRFEHNDSKSSVQGNAVQHVFPVLRCAQMYKSLESSKDSLSEVQREVLSACKELSIKNLNRYFTECLHRHISLYTVLHGSFDIAELVFSLEGLLTLSDACSVDKHIVVRVFQIVDEVQGNNAYWRPLKPFVTTPQGHALLPLTVEVANSLLRICGHLGVDGLRQTYYSLHKNLFQRYLNWVIPRVARGKIDGNIFVGWHSEHVHVEQKIHPWETSQILIFLLHHRALMERHIADKTLKLSNLEVNHVKRGSKYDVTCSGIEKTFSNFEPLCAAASDTNPKWNTYAHIFQRYIKPRVLGVEESKQMHFSALLFGPPGTGKTTVAEEVAKALGWELISVTPSDFIAHGEAEVESRAKAIFKTLEMQIDKVILLDEIDRMILDRDSAPYHAQGDIFQFMTPSMLVKLKNLRTRERSIFMVGTNYEDCIDLAAKRRGRIDDRLVVAPLDKKQRIAVTKSKIFEASTAMRQNDDEAQRYFEKLSATPEFEKFSARTALMTYPELAGLVEEAFKGLRDEDFVPEGNAKMLCSKLELHEGASIRIGNYQTRFPVIDANPECVLPPQFPFVEFLALIYLRAESTIEYSPEEEALLKRFASILKRKTSNLELGLKAILGDGLVFETIKSDKLAFAILTGQTK